MSLFSDVMEGYIGGYADTQLDAATEADIEARITDDAFTVSQYTGECFYEMMACEAAMYAVEGRCSVNYMAATSESAKAHAVAALEASISGAINKIKDLAIRAWEAVKKFIKKVWQKIKGFAATLRNAFKKFSESIDQSKLGGLKIKWQEIKPEGAYHATQNAVAIIKDYKADADNDAEKEYKTTYRKSDSDGNPILVNGKSVTYQLHTLNKEILDDFRKDLGDSIYPGEGAYNPKVQDASSGSVIQEAIRIADLGYDKYFNNFLKLGEKTYQDSQKDIKKNISKTQDQIDEYEDNESKAAELKTARMCMRAWRIQLQVVQEGTKACQKAIQQMFSLAVKACRAAVRYSHGDKTATTKESYTNFDETFASIL